MKLIKEPKEIDFTVNGRDLTTYEQQKISEYIQRNKDIRIKKTIETRVKKQLPLNLDSGL